MQARMFRNIYLRLTDQDVDYLEEILTDPLHSDINVSFEDIIETDDLGNIIMFMPRGYMKWELVFYLQTLMIRQRLEEFDRLNALYRNLE